MPADGSHRHGHRHPAPTGPTLLRERGRRLTRQRRLIWEAFLADPDGHLSAEDVVAWVRAQLSTVNPSTIYRTLELLVEEGLVRRTDLGADRTFFELAREHLHHHVVCARCGAVVHVHDEVLGDLGGRLEAAAGYTLGGGELTIPGVCPACRRT
ncbi:MAG: Fur family transcriptional regulator [Thermoleophilaceae bacterium]|jgi:Fur family ferric uptake transcriptional regulator